MAWFDTGPSCLPPDISDHFAQITSGILPSFSSTDSFHPVKVANNFEIFSAWTYIEIQALLFKRNRAQTIKG